MNLVAILAIAALIFSFGGMHALNYDFSAGKAKVEIASFKAPYYFAPGDFTSYLNAYFFVFVFSLLFFGFSAPIALGIEGTKYASFAISGSLPAFDYVFLIPEMLAAYSAIVLGGGILNDIDGENVFEKWSAAVKFFVIGLVLMVALALIRPYLVG
ncbi:MAG: hypothetical protein AABX01_05510 [Candidatus Micrarchaeota archaeon]